MTKTLLEAEFERNGEVKLILKTSPEIEEFWKRVGSQVRQSDRWIGHKFYTNTPNNNSENSELGLFLDPYYDSYGGKMINSGKFNIALLRTVGIKDGKTFNLGDNDIYSDVMLRNAIENLKVFTTNLYKKFIKPIKIKLIVEEVV